MRAHVRFGVEARIPVHFPREISPVERAVRDKPYPELLNDPEGLLFMAAESEGVLVFHGRHRKFAVRPSYGFSVGFAHSPAPDLPFAGELAHGSGHLLYRDFPVYAVLVIDVYAVGSQAFEGRLNSLPYGCGPGVLNLFPAGVVEPEFAPYQHAVAVGCEGFADELLVRVRPVDFRGVEEVYAQIHGFRDEVCHRLLVARQLVVRAHAHAPEPHCRDLHRGFSASEHSAFSHYGGDLRSAACAARVSRRLRPGGRKRRCRDGRAF